MKTKTKVKAGRVCYGPGNHNETLVRKAKGLRVKTRIKAGPDVIIDPPPEK